MRRMVPTSRTKVLSSVVPGSRARVVRIDAGCELTARLIAMGLVPGTTVDVMSANGGPMIMSVLGARLMLGRGMAAKVLVRELDGASD